MKRIKEAEKEKLVNDSRRLDEYKLNQYRRLIHKSDEDKNSNNLKGSLSYELASIGGKSKLVENNTIEEYTEDLKPEFMILSKLYLIITKVIVMNFSSQFHSIYFSIVNIMSKFIDDKEFIKMIFSTALLEMTEMIILNKKNLSSDIIAVLINFFRDILIFLLNDFEELKNNVEYLLAIMKIPTKLTDKVWIKNTAVKAGLLDCIRYNLEIIDQLNMKNTTFSEDSKEELEMRKRNLIIFKQCHELNEDYKKRGGRLTGNEQLKSMKAFAKTKEIFELKDIAGLRLLIEKEEETITHLLREERTIEVTKNIIVNVLSDYRNSSVLSFLIEELKHEDTPEKNVLEILQCLIHIVHVDYSLEANIISYESEVLQISNIINAHTKDEVLLKMFYFLLIYNMKSYKLDLFGNFKLNSKINNSQMEEKFFSVFITTTNDEIKLLISLLFVSLSLMTEIWDKLISLGMIVPTTRFIVKYINLTCKDEITFDKNIEKVMWIVNLYYFVCEEKNFRRIGHLEFFKHNTNAILLLFRINHPKFRKEVTFMLDKFSIFYDCKVKIIDEKNFSLIHDVQHRILSLSKDFTSLIEINIDSTEKLKKLRSELYDLDMESVGYRKKYLADIDWFEEASKNSKKAFLNRLDELHELGSLIGILLNFIILEDYQSNFIKVFCLKEERLRVNMIKHTFGTLYNSITKCDDMLKYTNFLHKIIYSGDDTNTDEFLDKNSERKLLLKIKYLNRSFFQLTLVRIITEPFVVIKGNYMDETAIENTGDLRYYLAMIEIYMNDDFTFSKLLFSLYQFIVKADRSEKLYTEESKVDLLKLIETLGNIVFSDSSSSMVNREILRLFCSFSMFTDQSVLWNRFESEKYHLDYSNYSDLVLKYKNQDSEFEEKFLKRNFKSQVSSEVKKSKNFQRGLLMYTPYKRVDSYNDKMGVIFYSDQVLILPRPLILENNFTICFRFYNPVINTGKFHTLIQSNDGVPIVSITPDRKTIGCFTIAGQWVQSGIDLDETDLQGEWIQIVIAYRGEHLDHYENKILDDQISFYCESNLILPVFNGKMYKLPRTAQYIGNTKSMKEPFGIFCDLRIYNQYCNDRVVKELYSEDVKDNISNLFSKKLVKTILANFTTSSDSSQDSFFFTIKFFNHLLSEAIFRKNNSKLFFKVVKNEELSFHNQIIFNKIVSFYWTYIPETKKQIAKYLKTIT